jgi:hypothetical protein
MTKNALLAPPDRTTGPANRPTQRSRIGRVSALPLCGLLAVGIVQCGGEDAAGGGSGGNNNNLPVDGDTDSGTGGLAGGPGFNQDGGRTELTSEQVDEILGAECTGWEGEGEKVPATLQLVVDTSGSMSMPPPDTDGISKWEITRDALETAVAGLPGAVSLGVLYYPNKNVTSSAKSAPGPITDCVTVDAAVPLAPLGGDGSEQREAFEASLDAASVESYTPTHDAYQYALDQHLVPYPAAAKFLLLITDGAPTIDLGCSWPSEPAVTGELYDGAGSEDGATDPIIAAVQAARDNYGIRTFLIGAPGSEKSVESGTDKRPWLSQAAIAGGTDTPGCAVEGPDYCHFDMTESTDFAAELTAGLAEIGSQVADSCTFAVPDAPDGRTIEPETTQVIIEWGNGKKSLIIPDGIAECSDGWKYNSADDTIVLCDLTCDEVKIDPQAVVHVSFGCSRSDIDDIVK